tara:strand:+ start:116 stop:802 length:687 start_codon:yes stop_codon:yes gene_type:complete
MDLQQEQQQWWVRWQEGRIGFHLPEVNPLLIRHVHSLATDTHPNERSCILVPLCGKSKDLIWLQSHFHKVIGVELVPQAVEAFFEENQITPTYSLRDSFATYLHGNLALLQGDIFQMSSKYLEDHPIQAIFDRASLIALPDKLRKNYVALLRSLGSCNTKLLLVTLAYEEGMISGPPHSIPENKIFELFAFATNIELLEKQDILPESPNFQKAGLRWAYEAVYLITFP